MLWIFLYITALSISKITIIIYCFPSIFLKDFQRNLQDSIQMLDITKRNLNVHFIVGNIGHVLHRLTVIAPDKDYFGTETGYHVKKT